MHEIFHKKHPISARETGRSAYGTGRVCSAAGAARSALAVAGKIGGQDGKALLPQHAAGHLGPPVGAGKNDLGADAALLPQQAAQVNVAGPVDQPAQPGPHHGPAAHKAGLAAGIEGVLRQVRDPRLGAEPAQQAQLRVEGGVGGGVNLVFVGHDHLPVLHQQRAEGLVAVLRGRLG